MSLSHIIIRFSVCLYIIPSFSFVVVLLKGANVLFIINCANSFSFYYFIPPINRLFVNNKYIDCFIRIFSIVKHVKGLTAFFFFSSPSQTHLHKSYISNSTNHYCRALSLMLLVVILSLDSTRQTYETKKNTRDKRPKMNNDGLQGRLHHIYI